MFYDDTYDHFFHVLHTTRWSSSVASVVFKKVCYWRLSSVCLLPSVPHCAFATNCECAQPIWTKPKRTEGGSENLHAICCFHSFCRFLSTACWLTVCEKLTRHCWLPHWLLVLLVGLVTPAVWRSCQFFSLLCILLTTARSWLIFLVLAHLCDHCKLTLDVISCWFKKKTVREGFLFLSWTAKKKELFSTDIRRPLDRPNYIALKSIPD